jgi:hypothetical protein
MALFPCDICRRRYVGVGNSAYLGWVAGGFNERRRMRLCPGHLEQVESFIEARFNLVQVGDDLVEELAEQADVCDVDCTARPTTTYFAHVYRRNELPRYFVASRCATHADIDVLNPLAVAA